MLKFEGHTLLSALALLSQLDDVAQNDPNWLYKSEERMNVMVSQIDILSVQLEVLDLRLSIKKLQSIKTAIKLHGSGNLQALSKVISSSLKELQERIQQELEDRNLFYVDAENTKYINDGEHSFSPGILDKFKDAVPDLSEAAKCLGMGRNTACVFHLMRSMESAIQEMGRLLNVTITGKNNRPLVWGVLIGNIDKKVKEIQEQDRRESWAAVVALLIYVKDCWRNPTMHPRQTYTKDEAREIFLAVRTFMGRLVRELS